MDVSSAFSEGVGVGVPVAGAVAFVRTDQAPVSPRFAHAANPVVIGPARSDFGMGEGCGASRSVVEEYPFVFNSISPYFVARRTVTAVQLNLIAPSPAAAVSVGDAKSSEDSVCA